MKCAEFFQLFSQGKTKNKIEIRKNTREGVKLNSVVNLIAQQLFLYLTLTYLSLEISQAKS